MDVSNQKIYTYNAKNLKIVFNYVIIHQRLTNFLILLTISINFYIFKSLHFF